MPAFSLQNMLAERGFRPQAYVHITPNLEKINTIRIGIVGIELSIPAYKKYHAKHGFFNACAELEQVRNFCVVER